MSPFSLFVTYLLIWWMTLFVILPMGIKGQAESGEVIKGSEPGAPVDANTKGKFKQTTILATIIWVFVNAIIWSGIFNWDQMAVLLGLNAS